MTMTDFGLSISNNNTAMVGLGNITSGLHLQGTTTSAPLPSRGHSSEKHALAQFLEIYYSLALLVFGTIGNLLSLAVLSRKAFRSSPIGICLRFLALADLTALYTGPLYFTAIALHDYNFRKVSVASCRIHRWVSYASVDLSAWTLIVMSTARLTSVLWPMKNIFTRRKTYIALFVTFVIIVGINSPMFILYGTVHLPHRTLLCVATNPSYRYFTDHIWSWLVLVKFGLLPGSILLVVNIILVIRVYRSRRHVDKLNDGEEDPDRVSISPLGRAKISIKRWVQSSKFFARPSTTAERPNSRIVKNIDSREEGNKIADDRGKGRTGFRTSTETIVSTVTENERSHMVFYDRSRNSHSGDTETLCQNGETFLQVPAKRPKAKGLFSFATFPKNQLRKLQKKYGTFTFPKMDRRSASDKTADTSRVEEDGRSKIHDGGENGGILRVAENDKTSKTPRDTFRGKNSQSYCDGITSNIDCPLNTEKRSRSLSPMTRVEHSSLKLLFTEEEDEEEEEEKKISSISGRGGNDVPSENDFKSTGNNSLPHTTSLLCDPRGSEESFHSAESSEILTTSHKDNITSDNGRNNNNNNLSLLPRRENGDSVGTPSERSVESDTGLRSLPTTPQKLGHGSKTLSDSNIHRTTTTTTATSSSINSNNKHVNNNNSSDDVNTKTNNKDVASGANLTKSVSTSAVYDHDLRTPTTSTINNKASTTNFPRRVQTPQMQNSVSSLSRDGKQLSFTRASAKCTELSISTHTLPADTNSLMDYLNKHHHNNKDINVSSNSMNSISDTSIHELKLAVKGKFSTRSRASRSHRIGVDNRSQKHRNLTLTVIVFNAMFILCNLPIIIYMAGRTYMFSGEKGTNSPQYVMEICSNYSMYTNNAINFVLYCITGSRFRQELKRMLCQFCNFFTGCCCCRRKK